MAGVDDDVDGGQFMLMQPKRFTNQTSDAVTPDCITDHSRRDRQAQPGMRSAIVTREDGEEVVGDASRVAIDAIEFRFLPEAVCRCERPRRELQAEW